jgi:glutaconate CoA-transferase subunit A
MLGTDTFAKSAAVEVACPFTGKPVAVVPALYPEVAFIHVHEADPLGNCRIRGISVADEDLARASKRVIVTAERIVRTEEIRRQPEATVIPSFCVDAVCEVRYGSFPGNMPGEYASDEEHLRAWLAAEREVESLRGFLARHVYDTGDFDEYLSRCGGLERMKDLVKAEVGAAG